MFNWVLFAILSILAYVCIAAFGQFGGGSATSALSAALSTFKPLPLLLLIVGNILWGVAVYFGLRNTSAAIPAAIALGVVTSFFYSTYAFGTAITLARLAGVAVILFGIYLLR